MQTITFWKLYCDIKNGIYNKPVHSSNYKGLEWVGNKKDYKVEY